MNLEYISGFLDAEGHVTIIKQNKNPQKPNYYLCVGFTNTSKLVMYDIAKTLGSTIQIDYSSRGRGTPIYRTQIRNEKANLFLQKIKNLLQIKKNKAYIGMNFAVNKINLSEVQKQDLREQIQNQNYNDIALSSISYQYIAGFFDGEGHIGISKRVRNNRASPSYSIVIILTNESKALLDHIAQMTGGTVYKRKNKQVFDLHLTGQNAKLFLNNVKEYLIIKKKEAEIAIAFQNELDKRNSNLTLSKKEVLFRETCKQELMNLHGSKWSVE